ncbi:Hsp20/alpha crystallin family protein [Saccharicrinis aurantiacus]|uniref:Hsp20/alpha crystallin family protein n=1 Tax=Saccharicrinis aurantiacus TaxID=1849719 RepID=UPI00249192C0|nr:Hsp20/alpha crystallin family protein [Saccharicrinis aurantiacus]
MTVITRKQRGLDSMLNEFMGGDFFMTPQGMYSGNKSVPAANIYEDENSYSIELAAPGLKKEDFSIEFNNGLLSISASVEENTQEGRKQTLREFNYSSFKKSFKVAKQKVDDSSIEAEYLNGVLSVLLPKKEEAKMKPKRVIEIK